MHINFIPGAKLPSGPTVKIDMLIGLDYYWNVVDRDVLPLTPSLGAQKTKLGWVVSGSTDRTTKVSSHTQESALFAVANRPQYSRRQSKRRVHCSF